jgi:hypothetical protein
MITNNANLPEAVVAAIRHQREEYDNQGSNLSASGITLSPRQYWLKERHKEEIVEDASDLIWSLLGTSVHNILEGAGKKLDDNHMVEERFSTNIEGWKFSGQLDHYDIESGTLSDYKITSVWSVINDTKDEWIAQLNSLRYLLHEAGHEVNKLQSVAILRDWSRTKAEVDKSYPQSQVQVVDIPVWDLSITEAYLHYAVSNLQIWEGEADENLPHCTPEQRWAKPTTYAVIKDKNKRATKVLSSQEEADKFIANCPKPEEYKVEAREGENTRCKYYCNVAKWCTK